MKTPGHFFRALELYVCRFLKLETYFVNIDIMFMFLLQHVVLAIKAAVAILVPDVPKWVLVQIAKQEYAAKLALRKQVIF